MLDNAIDTDYRKEDIKPINDYELPKMLPRFAAASIDLAIFILLSFVILTISGLIVGKTNQNYINSNETLSSHIEYSKLAKYEEKNGYVSYSDNDLLTLEDNNPLIINKISYFYLSYLTGENIESGYEASLNKDDMILIDGLSYLPKDYYNVAFFNEKILKLKDENQEIKYFKYQETDGVKDESKIALIDEQYIEDVVSSGKTIKRLKNDSGLLSFLKETYQNAINDFYAQPAIKDVNKVIRDMNIILMFVAAIPSLIIFYILIPLLSPFGKTVGKYIFKLAVVDDRGYLVKKWRLLLRVIPILGATIYVCIINSLYFQLLAVILLLLISLGTLVFTPKKKALHDLMSGTIVIKTDKNTFIYPDEEHYQKALDIIKQRKEASNGPQ